LTNDASQVTISFILSQKDNEGRERVIEYGERALHKNELNWTVSEKEALAAVEGVRQYHTYLSSQPFQIVTDHITLSYLSKMRLSGNSRLARWALELQPYRYEVVYRKGANNQVADAIFRLENAPIVPVEVQPSASRRANKTPEQRIARTLIEFDVADSISEQPIIVAPIDETARTSTPTFADIVTAQADCPDFTPIIAYLKDGTLPQDVKQARRIVAESQDFVIENQALYHLFTPRKKTAQIVCSY
jgi:hypothetical protein